MINAVVTRCCGHVVKIKVNGHSGYAARGQDIVCAAVSAVVQTAVLGLEHTPGVRVDKRIDEGDLECTIDAPKSTEASIRADAITQAMLKGLQSIEAGHKRHVKLQVRDIEEVSTCS